jgi:hypothetical protein
MYTLGGVMPRKAIFTSTELEHIKSEYLSNKTIGWIADEYNYNLTTVYNAVKQGGYQRSRAEAAALTRCYCDETYFETINTEAKAYWLGFLYADAGISTTPQHALYLGLSVQDKEHVEAFKKALSTNFNIGFYDYKTPMAVLRVSNTKIVNDLIRLGCVPKKTFILEPPNNHIPQELWRHFVRGYLDGDGCVSTSCGRLDIIFLGTENLLNWIASIIPFDHSCGAVKPKGKNIYRLNISCKREDKHDAIYHWLYDDATIFLERKRIKFE